MAVNYTSARFSAEDDNGRPLVGGRLFTYQNGTTTPAVTYKDAAGTTPNTNPIILDARGEAIVHVLDNQVYTFVLQNRFGSLVWSQNGIVGVSSTIDLANLQGMIAISMADYAALRAYSGSKYKTIRITKAGLDGIFYLDPSDTTSVDDGGTVLVDSAGRRWKRYYDGKKNVRWFGVIGDGEVDDTANLQKVFTLGGDIYNPPEVVARVTATLNLVSETRFYNDGLIVREGAADAPSVFLGVGVSNVSMYTPNFRNDSANDNLLGLDLRRCTGVYVFHPKARGCAVLQTIPLKLDGSFCTYAEVVTDVSSPTFNCSRDIHVLDVDCVGRGPDKGVAAVTFYYTVDCSVDRGVIDNIKFGVQWWGGDSNHTVDGAVANERKCRNVRVTGVSATNGLAGIWGSMGINVQVADCYAAYHDDVGIDPEGCLNVVISNNIAEHCMNGCFAGFYFNRDCSFIGNRGYQNGTNGVLMFATYNASNAGIPEYVVKDNSWVYAGDGFGAVALQAGINLLDYQGNYSKDCFFGTGLNNSGMMALRGNTWHFTKVIPSGVTVVYCAANNQRILNVHDNIVTADVAQAGTGVTIFASTQGDANSVVPSSFRRNEIFNFGPDTVCFRLLAASPNPGVVNPFAVIDNIYDGVIVNASAAGRSVEYFANNRKTSGAPV